MTRDQRRLKGRRVSKLNNIFDVRKLPDVIQFSRSTAPKWNASQIDMMSQIEFRILNHSFSANLEQQLHPKTHRTTFSLLPTSQDNFASPFRWLSIQFWCFDKKINLDDSLTRHCSELMDANSCYIVSFFFCCQLGNFPPSCSEI